MQGAPNAWFKRLLVFGQSCTKQSWFMHGGRRPHLQPSLLDALSTFLIHVNLSNICFGIAFKSSGLGTGLGSL